MTRFQKLLESPPPTTSWTIDRSLVGALRRDPSSGAHWAAEATPEGVFDVGPVGLQSVDRRKLMTVLGSIHGRLDGARRAAVVVPSAWTRSYRLEFAELPRRHGELEQVVQWRLKKLLPVPPSELRMSLAPLAPADGVRPLLAMVALERAVAELEGAFRDVGIEPGMITGRNFALAGYGGDGGARMIVQQEDGLLSLMLLDGDALRLIRTKPLAASGRLGDIVRRELGLTLVYIRDTVGVSGDIAFEISADDPTQATEMEQWLSGQPGMVRRAAVDLPQLVEPGAEERLGWARIRPAWSVLTGEIR